ncbi:MAG: GTPase ObgE [Phycisphaeraceae bacterium]|nr:GTPase ObgE [Phycisphaeraceae bacterium]
MFIDSASIVVRSGKGGDGRVSFRREKYIPRGGPNGGNGGKGGDVILHARPGLDTLLDFAGRHHWTATDGEPGGDKQMTGHDGEDLVIDLPPGTLVYNEATAELIVDLAQPGQRFEVAGGGKGGWGNEHFKSATNQTPREFTRGEPAVEVALRLELKLIADVGLVGKPNAGKSTLLSKVSRARPKIADYPFTTLEPNLGIAELTGHRRIVIADIPGLIEGAHEGHGLGMRFLRHVERTGLLVHLLELEPSDGSTPAENYRVVRRELEQYSPTLAGKPEVVVLTKLDLAGPGEEDHQAAVELVAGQIGQKPLAISSATGLGLSELLEACWKKLDKRSPAVGAAS